MIEQAIFTALSTTPEITAITGTRIYPLVLPTDPTLPAITYQIIASIPIPTLDSAIGLIRTRLQIDCWANSYGDAASLRDAIFEALSGQSVSAGDVQIQNFLLLNSTDRFDHEALQYRCLIEFYCWH